LAKASALAFFMRAQSVMLHADFLRGVVIAQICAKVAKTEQQIRAFSPNKSQKAEASVHRRIALHDVFGEGVMNHAV
jgi:hypothetical protein